LRNINQIEWRKLIAKDKNVVIIDYRSDVRSITARQILKSIGIENTYNLLGGIFSWDGKVVLLTKFNKAI